MVRDSIALMAAARATHKGAGGAALCICGASCGGSAACSSLNMLKIAVTTRDPLLRYSIAYAFGWASEAEYPSRQNPANLARESASVDQHSVVQSPNSGGVE